MRTIVPILLCTLAFATLAAAGEPVRPLHPEGELVRIEDQLTVDLDSALRQTRSGIQERTETRFERERTVLRRTTAARSGVPTGVEIELVRQRSRTTVEGGQEQEDVSPLEGSRIGLTSGEAGTTVEILEGKVAPAQLTQLKLTDPLERALPEELEQGKAFEAVLPDYLTIGLAQPEPFDLVVKGQLDEIINTLDGRRMGLCSLTLSARYPGAGTLDKPTWRLELEGTLEIDLTRRRLVELELSGKLGAGVQAGDVELVAGGPVTWQRRYRYPAR